MNFWEPRTHKSKKRVVKYIGRSPHWSIETRLKPGLVVTPHRAVFAPSWTLGPKTTVVFNLRLRLAKPKEGRYTFALHYRAHRIMLVRFGEESHK